MCKGRRGHPLWEEPEGFIASRILDEGYDEMTDVRPVGARPGFNNGWPRLPKFLTLRDDQKALLNQHLGLTIE